MPEIPRRTDSIQFLVERRYPLARTIRGLNAMASPASRDNQDSLLSIESYEDELRKMTPDAFQALLTEEKTKQAHEQMLSAERVEEGRFFNQASAKADVSHWSKTAYWTLDEATALSFGKDPKIVNWDKIKSFVQGSAFAERYARLKELVERAYGVGQLSDPIAPGDYVAWAKQHDISLSDDIEAAVITRAGHVTDWKNRFEQTNLKLAEVTQARDELRRQLDEFRTEFEAALKVKTLHPKERDSLLKLVLGMAIGFYGYEPAELRSKKVAEIASDLDRVGISLDIDTVRKWLREAAETVSPDTNESLS